MSGSKPDPKAESIDPTLHQAGYDTALALKRGLGHREQEIMKVIWARGGVSVQQVAQSLSTGLAYTTVMTTLDRLFKKGLLQREKKNRAYFYSASLTSAEMERQRATSLVRNFFLDSKEQPEVLLSCLLDAVDEYDTGLLDELEARIKLARAHGGDITNKESSR